MQANPYPNDPNYMPPIGDIQRPVPYQSMPPSDQNSVGVPYGPQYVVPAPQNAEIVDQRKEQTRKYNIAKVMDYLQWVLLALELLFLVRFGLKILGADPTNPFSMFVYNLSGFFLYPFEGILPDTKLRPNGVAVIEWSTLVGMGVYALLFYIVRMFLSITISRPQEPIE